jgi:hypothetical protein
MHTFYASEYICEESGTSLDIVDEKSQIGIASVTQQRFLVIAQQAVALLLQRNQTT